MAYETDYSPVDYLKRRIIYYQKKRGWFKRFLTDKERIKRYGKKAIKAGLVRIENRILEYTNAIETLLYQNKNSNN